MAFPPIQRQSQRFRRVPNHCPIRKPNSQTSPVNCYVKTVLFCGTGGGGFFARLGGGGGGPRFARPTAELPTDVEGDAEASPYDKSGELFDAESSPKTSPSCGRSTVLRLLRAVRTIRVSLGTRDRGLEPTGDISRRIIAGAS